MELASKALIKFWIDKVNDYVHVVDGMKIDPLPNVQLVDSSNVKNNRSDLLISTGGYMPALNSIVLYIDNRHLKDILRSYCHELVHHNQNLENSDYLKRVLGRPDDLVDNAQLEEIEGDAYLRGNLLFRKFTEWFKRQKQKEEKR